MPPGILHTSRLRLVPWSLDQVDALHRLWTDPDVRRYLWDDEIIPRGRAEETVRRAIASTAEPALGFWSVEPAGEPGAIVGFVGLMRREGIEGAELLYGLHPAWWGRGLATEAAAAVLDHGFAAGLERITAATDPPNAPSVRVMDRLGLRFAGEGELEGRPAVFYSLTRDERRRARDEGHEAPGGE